MIQINLDKDAGIVIVKPSAPLSEHDFKSLANEVDPYLEREGKLNGLIIQIKSFPGWQNFAGLISHLKFIRDHHKKIIKVAAVSNSKIVSIMLPIVDHFINAKMKSFSYENLDEAILWVNSQDYLNNKNRA